jgi:hypothetical protein
MAKREGTRACRVVGRVVRAVLCVVVELTDVCDTVLDFRSGDVLVFNGGTEWGIYHGIDTVVAGSTPEWLPELASARLSLQLRQSERNDNRPPPNTRPHTNYS